MDKHDYEDIIRDLRVENKEVHRKLDVNTSLIERLKVYLHDTEKENAKLKKYALY